jgi:hypothetical protein
MSEAPSDAEAEGDGQRGSAGYHGGYRHRVIDVDGVHETQEQGGAQLKEIGHE